MAFEAHCQEPAVQFDSDANVSCKKTQRSVSTPTTPENLDGCFDCNICLDSARDPVVTLCGHLYCWPCIYKWLHVQSSSHDSDGQPKCPVCKASISNSCLVPLYGRGTSASESEAKRHPLDVAIPCRPPPPGTNSPSGTATSVNLYQNSFQPQPDSIHHQQSFSPFSNYTSMPPTNFRGTTMASLFTPAVTMFGELVFARISGSSDTSLFTYPNTVAGSGGPRTRRQDLQADKSLNRLCSFLVCCLVLCLLLF